jgi:acyl dehydratase
MKIGDFVEIKRAFEPADVADYAELSGHAGTDDRVPEPLVGALFSYLLGVKLPGNGANYLKQDTQFHNEARVGDTLTARVEITRIRPDKQLVDLATTCTNSAGELIAAGRALVSARDVDEGLSAHD